MCKRKIEKKKDRREIQMDYKDLANLIFPDAKEIAYYEEKDPERNLKEGAMVTLEDCINP